MTTVWLHGAGLNAEYWDQMRAPGLHLDLPGHGGRARAVEATPEAFAETLLPECPPRFDLVGHSLGGMVAIVVAATHPQRVRRLVLVETWPGLQIRLAEPVGAWGARQLTKHLGPEGVSKLSASYQRGVGRQIARQSIAQMDADALTDAMRAATAFDGWALLARITAPTLVLQGARNRMTPWLNRRMAQALPNAVMEQLPGGHLLPTDCADAFYDRVARFLADDARQGS